MVVKVDEVFLTNYGKPLDDLFSFRHEDFWSHNHGLIGCVCVYRMISVDLPRHLFRNKPLEEGILSDI